MLRRLPALLLVCLVLLASRADALTWQVDADQKLIGATGVDVGGVSYDVTFGDGDCAALFNGCDATSDFTFQTQAEATAASQALLDSVFVSAGDLSNASLQYGLFPGLTFGCASTSPFGSDDCWVFTPYLVTYGGPIGAEPRPIVHFMVAANVQGGPDFVTDGASDTVAVPDASTSRTDRTWAQWTRSPGAPGPSPAIPEPGAFLTFAAGLLAVSSAGSKRR